MNEDLAKFQSVLGPDFGQMYFHLFQEWDQLKVTWKLYFSIFCSSKERTEFVFKLGGTFFKQVERNFIESVILSLCRLTDPKEVKIRKDIRKNLTIHNLEDFVIEKNHKLVIQSLIKTVNDRCEANRFLRNRHIAHADLNLRLGLEGQINIESRKEMEETINALDKIFEYIELEYFKSAFDKNISIIGPDAVSFLSFAYIGMVAIENADEGGQYDFLNHHCRIG